ncbi:MAG TPA: hypothetical protein VHB02_06100 [Acidimicrobiales bacterium]|nr:hypothetical protein [Acidimicrobiales bacterium]
MSWSTSNRHGRLPGNWAAIRQATFERDGGICQSCGKAAAIYDIERKRWVGGECDHVEAGDDHTRTQTLCTSCHRAKSSREGAAARPTRNREPERHPGRL